MRIRRYGIGLCYMYKSNVMKKAVGEMIKELVDVRHEV
jgi:hypothetical protein